MILTTGLLLAGLLFLVLGGEFLVRGASSIALRAHLSPLVVGLTVVAFGTSAPELLVSVRSALGGVPDIAMGNVVGSNICNLALVLGTTALILPIFVQNDSLRIDWPLTMGSSALLFVFCLDGWLNWYEGLFFVFALIVYLTFIIRRSRKKVKAMRAEQLPEDIQHPSQSIWLDVAYFAAGCVCLYFGADWFVTAASELAAELGVTERVIGITVVALGTSLPELVTSAVASIRKEADIAIGNLLGSNIFNVLSILGITSLVKEISVNPAILHVDMIWMLGITLLIFPMMLTRRELNRLEGGILLSVYCVYTYLVISVN